MQGYKQVLFIHYDVYRVCCNLVSEEKGASVSHNSFENAVSVMFECMDE